jgi:hypothetical protein
MLNNLKIIFVVSVAFGLSCSVICLGEDSPVKTVPEQPATFDYDRAPLRPQDWPSWQEHINRERVYDFYAKQAEFFGQQPVCPPLLQGFVGLDGGKQGHWGNQNADSWANSGWMKSDLGSVQCGVLRAGKVTVARAVCLQLGGGLSACFNPDTLCYEAVWTGGFVTPSSKRHGLIDGLKTVGQLQEPPKGSKPREPFVYHGYYRHGRRVVFSYRIGDLEYLDAPSVRDGKFHREVALAEAHPLKHLTQGGPPQWEQKIQTGISEGTEVPYAIDRIDLPTDNPRKALVYCTGHDFLADGSAGVWFEGVGGWLLAPKKEITNKAYKKEGCFARSSVNGLSAYALHLACWVGDSDTQFLKLS